MRYKYSSSVPWVVRVWVETNQPSPGNYAPFDLPPFRVWSTGKVEML